MGAFSEKSIFPLTPLKSLNSPCKIPGIRVSTVTLIFLGGRGTECRRGEHDALKYNKSRFESRWGRLFFVFRPFCLFLVRISAWVRHGACVRPRARRFLPAAGDFLGASWGLGTSFQANC